MCYVNIMSQRDVQIEEGPDLNEGKNEFIEKDLKQWYKLSLLEESFPWKLMFYTEIAQIHHLSCGIHYIHQIISSILLVICKKSVFK